MNAKKAKEIIATHKRGDCEECFEGECMDEAKGFLEAVEKFKPLEHWLEHDRNCIRTFQEAGEPTKDGGYRTKFKGKWYQSKPIDETPKCDCGLDHEWEVYRRDVLGEKE